MPRPDIDSYRSGVRIDRDDLDTELSRQPDTFQNVGRDAVYAASRRDKKKDELGNIKARLYIKYKRDMAAEKPSETLLASHIEIDPEYVQAREEYMEAVKEAAEWEVVKESYIQRSYAIKDLVNLFVASYFGTGTSTAGTAAKKGEADYASNRAKIAEARAGRATLKTQAEG